MSVNSFDDEKKDTPSVGGDDYYSMFTDQPEAKAASGEDGFQQPYNDTRARIEVAGDEQAPAEKGRKGKVLVTAKKDKSKKTGCLGGVMYFVFVVSVSVILACLVWMAASDVLALNKEDITAEIVLPEEIFTTHTRTVTNDDGTTKEETYTTADMGKVASILKDGGIIQYPILFKLYSSFSNADEKVDPGSYQLTTELDYRAIVKKMQFGSDSQIRTTITFPEGFTMRQIFARLEENKICKAADLTECATNEKFSYFFLDDIPLGEETRLEGYLFPDTYEFYQGMTPEAAIDTFLQIFNARLTKEMLDLSEAKGMTLRQTLTIASMVEKETSGSADDRANIASVIYNRLKAGMPLGVDATSLYTHPDHEGAPTDEMLNDSSDPYNTRINKGLPPTPICNPGLASITATIKPAETNYYYYALDTATGEHKFFNGAAEFNAFVATQNYD